ncbi:MAG: hypothetical protein ACREQ5_25770 [Candidatus Dormibacteria bacterium]
MQHHLVSARRVPSPHRTPIWCLVGLSWSVLAAVSLVGDGTVIRHDRLLQGGPRSGRQRCSSSSAGR